jgi:2-oxoglutarate dehydrogenase E2 component (dihydrolipoamide succinyltransferase)
VRAVRRSVSIAASLLVLALPGTALAQTPGDDQYTDPFGSGQDQSSAQATPTPTPTPAPAAPAPATAAPAPTATAAPAVAASQQLPRTGGDPITPAVAGFWLLLGGVALRARTRSAS